MLNSNELIQHFLNLSQTKSNTKPGGMENGMTATGFGDIKKVIKPWGFEIWISDATETPYAMKFLYIKKGTKTSLQYHKKKSEHNCLLAGKINLHYKNASTGKMDKTEIGFGNVIKVLPGSIHRVEALTDIILIESSSAELDDVIRIDDDYNRNDGKIESEHIN